MSKILVVDDEPNICEMIQRYAKHDGHTTIGVHNGLEAVDICDKEDFDIIIMDVMMPEMDGFSACKRIREKKDIPVLMLSARGQEYDKLFGFEVGADDYMTKPFSLKELMARIHVITKRHSVNSSAIDMSIPQQENTVTCGEICIDILGHDVSIKGEKIHFTAKEYDILLYMIKNKGIVLTRNQILSAVWGFDYFGEDRTVDWQIKLLRDKLGPCRKMIHTIRGVGYKFDE